MTSPKWNYVTGFIHFGQWEFRTNVLKKQMQVLQEKFHISQDDYWSRKNNLQKPIMKLKNLIFFTELVFENTKFLNRREFRNPAIKYSILRWSMGTLSKNGIKKLYTRQILILYVHFIFLNVFSQIILHLLYSFYLLDLFQSVFSQILGQIFKILILLEIINSRHYF